MLSTIVQQGLSKIEKFFSTWRFPSFMLITLFLFWMLMMAMALMPVNDTAWGAFAEDFKVWCFGYDPETGSMQGIYLLMFTVNPFILSLVVLFVWAEPLKEVLTNPLIVKNYAMTSLGLVIAIGLSFLLMFDFPDEEEFEFRPDALRVSLQVPEMNLIDENEKQVSLEQYHGEVVILTSVYASCSDTCPMILDQAKRVLDSLSSGEREEVVLMAVTMHPEKDTPDLLKRISQFYRLEKYRSHLLTGEPAVVHELLDRLGVARALNTETGEIDHANLFFVIDREGKIAYRFALGDLQEDWMKQAIKKLIKEEPAPNVTEVYEELSR